MDALNSAAPVLLAPEQQDLWNSVNDTAADIPVTTLCAVFRRHAQQQPDHLAVVAGTRRLTYGDLARPAGDIAAEPAVRQIVALTEALLAGVPFDAVDGQRWPDGGPESVACLLRTDPDAAPVAITHDALVNTFTGLAHRFGLGGQDRMLSIGGLGDEVALSSILCTLFTGGTVVVADGSSPEGWLDLLHRERVTVWHSSPTRAALLVEHLLRGGEPPRTLRLALLGGEPLALTLADRLRTSIGPGFRVVNLGMYAAAGLWVTAHEPGAPEPRRGHAPIGAPLANKQVHVLTAGMTPCPVWVAGTIHIAGRGLPGAAPTPTAMIGRLLPDGVIDLVSDDTTRITIHGHPLSLYEVEGALATHPAVLTAAVVPAGDGSRAYVTTVPGAEVTGAALLDHLRRRMSPYLLPTEVTVLPALPLTAAGRIDRVALTAAANRPPTEAPAPPRQRTAAAGDLVARARSLAAKILDLPDIDPTANLLDFGATSVQLVRLAVRAEAELGIRVEVDQLLANPTVHTLVSFAEAAEATDPGGLILDPVDRMSFKDSQRGIRGDLAPATRLPLARTDHDGLARRRTHRTFAAGPVPARTLGTVLGSLRRLESFAGGEPKYAYPSAGSLYPVQVYLTVTAGRVEGIPAGAYYYHRGHHDLVTLTDGATVDAAAHAWINRDAFRASGFAVYLVADHSAIAPMYGDRARDYCLVEAGAMCQLLMTTATDLDIGFCPIGEMDVAPLRAPLRLGEQHEVLHVLLGGLAADTHEADRVQAEMVRRVDAVPRPR